MSTFRTFGRTLAVLALPAAMMMSAPAMAETDIVVTYGENGSAITQAKPVDISDLSLASARGRYVAKQRIVAAVKTVCSEDKTYGGQAKQDYERCFTEARAKAFADAGLTRTASR